MRKHAIGTALAIAAVSVVAAAPAAAAQGDNNGNDGNPVVSYVFKGTYLGPGGGFPTAVRPHRRSAPDLGMVMVNHGNAHVWKNGYVGHTVIFDFADADFVVADRNGDGVSNLRDVAPGDQVVVKSRLHLRSAGPQPFPADQLVDQTH
jgi:hypothetical protein